MDTTGVTVTLSVLDANGNFRTIGTAQTSDGTYAFTWTPDITGNYQVIASFDGSNSYYPSSATTYVYAGEAPTPVPTQAPLTGVATTADLMMYMALAVVAIIVAIVVVGLLIIKKK